MLDAWGNRPVTINTLPAATSLQLHSLLLVPALLQSLHRLSETPTDRSPLASSPTAQSCHPPQGPAGTCTAAATDQPLHQLLMSVPFRLGTTAVHTLQWPRPLIDPLLGWLAPWCKHTIIAASCCTALQANWLQLPCQIGCCTHTHWHHCMGSNLTPG